MNKSRLPLYHHCFQIPGEWESMIRLCSPLAVIHGNPQGCQTRQGFWWSAGGRFSITIKLPALLYGENSQGSLTGSFPGVTSHWLPPWRGNSHFLTLTAFSQHSSSNENWNLAWCLSSRALETPKRIRGLSQWPQDYLVNGIKNIHLSKCSRDPGEHWQCRLWVMPTADTNCQNSVRKKYLVEWKGGQQSLRRAERMNPIILNLIFQVKET